MLLNIKDTKKNLSAAILKIVAHLLWDFLQSYLTSDICSWWSCIPWIVIKYQTGPEISKCSQKIVTLTELKSSFKWFWRVGLPAKRPKKDPYRRQIHNLWIHIISYSSLQCWVSLKINQKTWENSQHLSWIRHIKAHISKTLT